jgi:Nitrile hydratase, alpha chain
MGTRSRMNRTFLLCLALGMRHAVVIRERFSDYRLTGTSWKPYRARAVKEPRAVLAEFGTNIPNDVEIRVSDSTAMVRYLVLPQRPDGTENFSEDELASLVTELLSVAWCL